MTVKKIAVAVAALGFLMALTELDGGPWAGTFIGAALFICGALVALNAKKTVIMPNKKGGAKNEIHLRVYRRPSGRDDAA